MSNVRADSASLVGDQYFALKFLSFVLRVCHAAALTNLIRSLLKQPRFAESAIDFHTSAAAFVTNEFKGLSPVASGL